MRRLVSLLGAAVIALLGASIVEAPSASAAPVCQQTDPASGQCLIWIEVPGGSGGDTEPVDDAPTASGPGNGCYWDGTSQGVSDPPPGPVPCRGDAGYWSNSNSCYVQALNPQPPAGDPSWQGHEPGDGTVYQCFQPQTGLLIQIWSQAPPPNSGAAPTPGEVAQSAVEQMNLRAVDVGITPAPGDNSVGIVGMPVWMWAAEPNSQTVGPLTASASAGGITITATARLHAITWDMGDGSKVLCNGAGSPYKPSYGAKKSPTCGHTYEESSSSKSGGKFTVTATSAWVITWAGAGQTGTIRLDGLARSVQITVGEAQVLVT